MLLQELKETKIQLEMSQNWRNTIFLNSSNNKDLTSFSTLTLPTGAEKSFNTSRRNAEEEKWRTEKRELLQLLLAYQRRSGAVFEPERDRHGDTLDLQRELNEFKKESLKLEELLRRGNDIHISFFHAYVR